MTTQGGRLHFLDSLRGFAAVYVVFFHALLVPWPRPALGNPFAIKAVHFGGTGVFLFFVISGFSLCLTMPRHDRSGQPWLSYGLSRFFRIAPLFYVILMLYGVDLYQNFGGLSKGDVLYGMTFVFNLIPGRQTGMVMASWTIGVEMLFYLVFPFLFRGGYIVQVAAGICSMLAFAIMRTILPPEYTMWTFVGYLPLFLVGMWAFYAYERLDLVQTDKRQLGIGITLVALVCLVACAWPPLAEKNVWLRVPIASGYALLLLGCSLTQPRFMTTRIATFFGKISYSLYLVHAPLIVLLAGANPYLQVKLGGDPGYYVFSGLVLGVATSIAYLFYRFVELPGVRLGNHIVRDLTRGE